MDVETKQFAIYCFSTFCASFGFLTAITFVPLLAKNIGASMTEIGIIGAAFFMVTAPMMYVFGRLSDSKGLRKWFIISGFVEATSVYFLLAISKSTIQLVMLMIALGLATSSYQPSMLVLVSRPSKKLMMGVKMGFYSASIAAGFGLGVISGGFMGDIFGLNWIFFPCGIMLTLGLFAMLQVFRNISEETEETEVFRRLGIRTLKKSLPLNIPKMFKGSFDSPLIKTGMLALCIAIFLRNSGFRGLTTFLPLYLKDLGASNSLLGMIISINFISQIILMPPAGWLSDIFGRKITISIGMFTSFIAMLLFSVINDPYSAIPIQILVGFSWSLILTSTNAYVADVIPMNKRGRGMGLIRSSQTLGGAVGPTLAGLSINFYGYRIMLQSLMVLPILGSILSFTKLKK